ncbi:MAG: CDP-glucose 4,6-dehydratase [Lachnospiraceae bacterium]|nr:CDP-glucose 4,6-dehydratase [Lachnospiraceae bacterium]
MESLKGKRVLVTGHTGFKGTWLTQVLLMMGAEVCGYSLEPPTKPSLFEMIKPENDIMSITGDVRDLEKMEKTFAEFKPEYVIHLAAQPLVRDSYINPVYTYETNVMGTVNMLECVRTTDSVRSVLNVTTDKVYKNFEEVRKYKEGDLLDGFDPYSNSKYCSELVTSSYRNSFLDDAKIAVSTARAGNVIGGGDYAANRIIPDCVRAALEGNNIEVRNPFSIRPYQHVLVPLQAYINILRSQAENTCFVGNYNIGPDDSDCLTTGELAGLFCSSWNEITGEEISWIGGNNDGPHEAQLLMLDNTKYKNAFGMDPKFNIKWAIKKTVEFATGIKDGKDARDIVRKQIKEVFGGSLK